MCRAGWLLGENPIANNAAMLAVDDGEDQIVMVGLRAQHRTQTHGTCTLFFNAVVGE